MRSWWRDLGLDICAFDDKIVKNDKDFDIKLDKKTKDFGEKNDDFVFEWRLARYFIPNSFKIFLKCEEEERYKRIEEREQLKRKWIKIEDIKLRNKKREKELILRYNKNYPNITFSPKEQDFDLVIDTTKIWPGEIVDVIMNSIFK